MTAFDPYAATPDWAGQGSQAVTAWQRANARINLQKNNAMQKYGFNQNVGDLGGSVTYNPDGTVKNVTESGGMSGVANFSDMAALDNQSGQGGFRDELNTEESALRNANNGPDRGFSGGLANQAGDLARRQIASRQDQFKQGYNEFASGINQSGTEAAGSTNAGLFNILDAQSVQASNQAAWELSQAAPAPPTGISGGGSTPLINQSNTPAFIQAHGTAGTTYHNPQAPVLKTDKVFGNLGHNT